MRSQNLQYKGYDGSVLYSANDKLLHGKLLGIRDLVSYEGDTVRSLEANFHDAVEEYLAFCKDEGKEAEVPFKGSFNVRVPADLHKRAYRFAEEHKLKLNTVVQQALSEYLAHAE